MNVKVEEAIEYWKSLHKTFSKRLKTEENYFGRMHLQTTIDVLDITIYTLENQETKEVVHGQWEDIYNGKYANPRYRCSICKEKALYKFELDDLHNYKEVQALTPNCSHCGAKMSN